MIWAFFLLKPGYGHETFSYEKLIGFILIIGGVLFFNKILVFDGFSIRYTGGAEDTKDKKKFEFKSHNSDEDSLSVTSPDGSGILPKL